MAECFCGCGRSIPLGRRRMSNAAARRVMRQLAVLEGAVAAEPPPDGLAELQAVVARGGRLRSTWRDYVHGTRSRRELDRTGMRETVNAILEQRKRLALADDFVGWNALGASELFNTGRRAPATLVDVRDTGMTVNDQPRAEVVLRVEPEGEEPFEVSRKLLVSRLKLPKVGERVEVAYDPEDRERFTFRIDDLTDDVALPPGTDPLERIARLHELHEAGALTAEEFAREKARVLEEER